MRRDDARGEEGSALVLALAFLTVLGIFIGAVLSFGSASVRASLAVRDQRDAVYAADGAVEGAINAIRNNVALGKDGGACPDFTTSFQEADTVRKKTVTVSCSGLPGSGAGGGSSSSSANTPAQAVLALRAPGGNGLVQSSNNELRIGGAVVSNTTVAVPVASASLKVDGTVTTKEGCTGNGSVTSNPVTPCVANPGAAVTDPGYAKRSDAPATPGPYQNLETQGAACSGTSSMVTFEPGLYTDAVALSAMTDGTACENSLFWFEPGVYYFDFVNSGSHEWKITGSNTNVVGGEPNGWAAASPRPSVSFPGGCKTSDTGATDGVQFVFGGDSTVLVQDAKVELCAKPTTNEQQIAVYGVPTGVAPAAAVATLVPTTNPANSSPPFSTPANAYVIGESPTALTSDYGATSPDGNVTGSVTLAGVGLGAVPAGSQITGIKVRLAHEETGSVDSLSLTVQSSAGSTAFANGNCNSPTAPSSRICIGGYRVQELDLSAAQVASVFPSTDALESALFKYDTTIKKNTTGTEKLDGIALVVSYIAPAYRAYAGTIITTRGSPAGLSIAGTVYAPTGDLDIQLTNISAQVIRRGVIGRSIQVQVTGSSSFTGNAIELPSTSTGTPADREVLFVATIDSVTRLRAVATLTDGGGATPGLVVKIEEWSVQR